MDEPKYFHIQLACFALPLLVLSGCDNAGRRDAVGTGFPGKLDNRQCDAFSINGPVPVDGTTFEYHATRYGKPFGFESVERLDEYKNGIWAYDLAIRLDDKDDNAKDRPIQSMQGVGGILTWSVGQLLNTDSFRTRNFDTDPARAIASLGIGDSVSIPSTESSQLGGSRRQISKPVHVTFLGCSKISFQGAMINTAVYETSLTYRKVIQNSGLDEDAAQTQWVYFWPEKGWWVRKDSPDHFSLYLTRIQAP